MRAVALALLAALTLSACESTQSKSRKLEKEGAGKAELTKVKAGAANTEVKVDGTTVLANKDGGKAVVVALDDTGGPQAHVPIQITAKDKAGKPLYKNDLEGLQASLQQMAFLDKGQKAYWVHDQVVAAQAPASVDVEVGRSKAPVPKAVPKIVLEGVRLDSSDPSGIVATGTVKNLSKVSQLNMPIYAVATKGAQIVAAGRAIIEKLDPEPQKKATVFRIFFVGDPKGAQLDVRAVPSTFTGATS